MKIAKIVTLFMSLLMAGVIAKSLLTADFAKEGSILLNLAWGQVSLIDLYVGFTLFSGWILYREKSRPKALAWIFLMMAFGFLTGSVYTLLALQRSRGNWEQFWLGHRAGTVKSAVKKK